MKLYIDTCVLPRCKLEEAAVYTNYFGPSLGIELLPMFDLQGWEENLRENLPLFTGRPLIFHEPVWGVEHSASRGSSAWKEGRHHLLLTKKYADILHPSDMVFHLNNGKVPLQDREILLKNAMESLEEMRGLFSGVRLLVENTGVSSEGTQILDQEEFTETSLAMGWDVLIDVGHANANGWDLFRLICDLKNNIRGFHLHNNDGVHDLHNRIGRGTMNFALLIPFIAKTVPEAFLVIEYCRPQFHGEPLIEDIIKVKKIMESL